MQKVIIKIPTLEEEFDNVWGLFKEMQRFREGFYRLQLPDHKDFLTAAMYAPYFYRKGEKELLLDIFTSQVYDKSSYTQEYDNLEHNIPQLNSVIHRFEEWAKTTPFFVPKTYTINLTKYGPGGGYNVGKESVTILVSRIYTKKPVIYSTVHEMVHIGIEKSLVKEYNLSFKEKETVVEWICATLLADFLPDYPIQPSISQELYEILGSNGITFLWKYFEETGRRIKEAPTTQT